MRTGFRFHSRVNHSRTWDHPCLFFGFALADCLDHHLPIPSGVLKERLRGSVALTNDHPLIILNTMSLCCLKPNFIEIYEQVHALCCKTMPFIGQKTLRIIWLTSMNCHLSSVHDISWWFSQSSRHDLALFLCLKGPALLAVPWPICRATGWTVVHGLAA